jgi:hypothetical protein
LRYIPGNTLALYVQLVAMLFQLYKILHAEPRSQTAECISPFLNTFDQIVSPFRLFMHDQNSEVFVVLVARLKNGNVCRE